MINHENGIWEKRLHPLTLVYRLITSLPNFAFPIIFVMYGGNTEDWIYILISIFIGFFILPGLILNYYYFDYSITGEEVIIRSGIFSKKERHIKIERIQNISVTQNFVHKILNIAKVQLETAGDATTEGVLDSVSKADAHHIKEVVRTYQNEKEAEKIEQNSEEISEENKDLLL